MGRHENDNQTSFSLHSVGDQSGTFRFCDLVSLEIRRSGVLADDRILDCYDSQCRNPDCAVKIRKMIDRREVVR